MGCEEGYHDCLVDSCLVCEEYMYWIDCPTGGWWKHIDHPVDGHDGEAEPPIHAEDGDSPTPAAYTMVECKSPAPCLCAPCTWNSER